MARKMKQPAPEVTVNREHWLQRALPLLQAEVFGPAALVIPTDVKVACSFPGGGSARKRIGECWGRRQSKANVNEIFISPLADEPLRVLDILCHELCHAIDDCKSGHKQEFVKLVRAIGLEGKPTMTTAGATLSKQLAAIIEKLGAYPHSSVLIGTKKKQKTYLVKCKCTDCGCTWRMTMSWLVMAQESESTLGCPVCHGGEIEVGGGDDSE